MALQECIDNRRQRAFWVLAELVAHAHGWLADRYQRREIDGSCSHDRTDRVKPALDACWNGSRLGYSRNGAADPA